MEKDEQLIKSKLYLIGLMGAGKTTVGRQMARKLQLDFYDSDREIEARTGVSVPTVFEIEGEDGFRRREAQVIAELATLPACVIATGGGVVLRPENRAALKKSGWVVYLDVPPVILWERTRQDRNRPLLRVEDPLKRLQELYVMRDPLYRETADYTVDGSRLQASAIVQQLLSEVEGKWKR